MENHSAWIFGEEQKDFSLNADSAKELITKGRAAANAIFRLSTPKIVSLLAAAGKLWRPGTPIYKEALAALSQQLPFSHDMVKESLDMVCGLLDEGELHNRVALELGAPTALDRWHRPTGRRTRNQPRGLSNKDYDGLVRAFPMGLMLHVSASNVFLGALDSIVQGMLTKNAAIVKLSSADPIFPIMFARSLAEVDEEGALAGSLALVSWRGGDSEVEEVFKGGVDGAIVWGGEEAVQAYRQGLNAGARLIEHGPKMSFAVITKEIFYKENKKELVITAQELAHDVALWDQAACASPQMAYLECSRQQAEDFAQILAEELEKFADKWPPGELDIHEQVELTKVREQATFEAAVGEKSIMFPEDRSARWTIIVTDNKEPEVSPLNRCIVLHPIDDIALLPGLFRPIAGYLQSVGVAGSLPRIRQLAIELGASGVNRFTTLGTMLAGVTGAPHDGRFGLQDLVRWVDYERCPDASPKERLGALLSYVRERSPFFKERLAGLDLKLGNDLLKIPFSQSEDIVPNVPPRGEDFLTASPHGAHVFASGGSTGQPKYVLYTFDEFVEVSRVLSTCFEAAGMTREDRCANIFVAGHLWTSFLAVHQALENVGCFSIPIGGTSEMSQTLRYVVDFEATVVLGIPSALLELARLVRSEGLTGKLHVRLLLYAGEHLAPQSAQFLSETFGGAQVRSAGYASVDAGTIGYQCEHCQGSWHHLLTDYQYLEFLHVDSGKPVAAGEVGEMVATNLNRLLQPVVRMKTGDLGRFSDSQCPCGSKDLLFELLGRADDRVFVGGARFMARDLDKVADAVDGLSGQVQVIVQNQDGTEKLTLKAEASGAAAAELRAKLAEQFVDAFLEQEEDVRAAVNMGWLEKPEAEVLEPGHLPRVARTGKVRRVIDERKD